MRRFRLPAVILIAALLPAVALAQSYGATTQTSSLVAQITALEQEIQSLTGSPATASSAPANPTSALSGNECPILNNNLSLGSSGTDVIALQTFLQGEGMFTASVTGYFGSITQSVVEQWQTSNGIVSSGSPSTTGFGAVGPRTRAAIFASCDAGQSAPSQQNACLPAQQPTTQCTSGWQPVAGANGCTAYYQCTIPLPAPVINVSGTATTSTPQSCPVVPKPQCNGTVEAFQTTANGCVTSYECVL